MTLPRTVAEVLADHMVLEVESTDRMYLNVWQPRLQFGAGAAGFFTGHRGHIYASAARLARHGRGHLTLHLPLAWHREREWLHLFQAGCGPPAARPA